MSDHPYGEVARELKELPWVVDAVTGFGLGREPTLKVRLTAAPFLGAPDLVGALTAALEPVRESLLERFGGQALITFEV